MQELRVTSCVDVHGWHAIISFGVDRPPEVGPDNYRSFTFGHFDSSATGVSVFLQQITESHCLVFQLVLLPDSEGLLIEQRLSILAFLVDRVELEALVRLDNFEDLSGTSGERLVSDMLEKFRVTHTS